MARYRVSCINKTNRPSAHERISHVGGLIDGNRWKHTSAQAIASIQNGSNSYYVYADGYETEVIVAMHLGNPYLKTERDTTTKDNLLSLPECP